MRRLALLLTALAACAAALDASATTAPYRLGAGSEFENGCFGPCACPVLIREPLEGGFLLTPVSSPPGVRAFAVDKVDWVFPGDGKVPVSGSGQYFIHDQNPPVHRMILHLQVAGGPPEDYDSGLVPGGDRFPEIDIDVASSGFYCWDSVFAVRAQADVAGALDLSAGPSLSVRSANPFTDQVQLAVGLPAGSRVQLSIHDGLGHLVRDLSPGSMPSGTHLFAWDGLRSDGSAAPAGMYYVRLIAGGSRLVRAVAKLR